MPFTPSHAVVALPFVRTPLVPAAVAIGAMTPDLPLFLRGVGIGYGFTHTYANVVWTCALAFGLFLVWRVLLRPAAVELAPGPIARRLPAEWADGWIIAARHAIGIGSSGWSAILLAASLLIGVVSHIVWDSFTHEGRWGVELIPALEEEWGPLLGYKWLQYGSGLVGIAVLAIWAAVQLARATPRPPQPRFLPAGVRIAWWISLPVVLITAWILGSIAYGPFTAEFTVAHLAYRVLPPACSVWGALTLVLCLLLPVFRSRHHFG